jgi:hypothetical protein
MDHIMVGEPQKRGCGWTGGHGHGERGYPNFPKAWDRDTVRAAVEQVLAGQTDLTIERYGATLFFRSVVDGLPMLVRVKGRQGQGGVRNPL